MNLTFVFFWNFTIFHYISRYYFRFFIFLFTIILFRSMLLAPLKYTINYITIQFKNQTLPFFSITNFKYFSKYPNLFHKSNSHTNQTIICNKHSKAETYILIIKILFLFYYNQYIYGNLIIKIQKNKLIWLKYLPY